MKIPSSINLRILHILLLAAALTGCSQPQSTERAGFDISIKETTNDIELTCKQGCAWTELSFHKNQQPQAIDSYGMTGNTAEEKQAKGMTDFLFTVSDSPEGLLLRGIRGTAWTDLDFRMNQNVSGKFNENGRVE